MANNEKVEFGECKEQPSEANNKQPAADVISGYLKDLINSRDLQEVIETQNFMWAIAYSYSYNHDLI